MVPPTTKGVNGFRPFNNLNGRRVGRVRCPYETGSMETV